MSKLKKHEVWVMGFDLHYPEVHWPTFNAMMDFLEKNPVDGFLFGGDQFDNNEISHHTKGKTIFRERAAYDKNTTGFQAKILEPLERVLTYSKKVWIIGNHDRFERDFIEEHPELEGMIERPKLLSLEKRGWEVIPLGHAKRIGKLSVIHGEVLTGIGNQAGNFPAKKAVELYAGSVLAGHTHSPQSFTRISPVEQDHKWMGWIAPILGMKNPAYLRNRPTAWMNGFVIAEFFPNGNFNLYPIHVFKGQFSYGGKTYGKVYK